MTLIENTQIMPKKTHRITARIPRHLRERLDRAATPSVSESWLICWLLEYGLDQLEEIGIAGIVDAYWRKRGRPGTALGLLIAEDRQRDEKARPQLQAVKP